jgi:hypothetical protein
MMRRVKTSKAKLVAFKFVRVWMPSEKEKDEGVIGGKRLVGLKKRRNTE